MNDLKSLPCCPDLERFLIGHVFKQPKFLDAARPVLSHTDFFVEMHRQIWRRMCDLYDAGRAIDFAIVHEEMRIHDEAQPGLISRFVDLEAQSPIVPQVGGYIKRILEASIRRRAITTAEHLQNLAADESEPLESTLTQFEANAVDLARTSVESCRPQNTSEIIQEIGISTLLEPRHHRGLVLPFPQLDAALCGFGPGQVIVLMAATSRGKTSAALQIALSAADAGKTPMIWTMEMSPQSMVQRMLTQMTGVWATKRQLSLGERNAQTEAISQMSDHPVYFDRTSRSVSSFIGSIRQTRTAIKFAVVDYLQLIRGSGRNRAQEVSDNSRAIKLAAMDLQIPFLVLSQVDRASVKGEGKIGLHSGKETGDIENDADVVLWIDAAELSREQDTAVAMHIGKQREGPAGFSIPMVFRPTSQTFMEVQNDR